MIYQPVCVRPGFASLLLFPADYCLALTALIGMCLVPHKCECETEVSVRQYTG